LHKQGYIHNDIKPDNILLKSAKLHEMKEELVLIDFGCAKIFPSTAMFSFDKQPFSFSGNFLYASHNAF
jgi:serine/threonine protein kinase